MTTPSLNKVVATHCIGCDALATDTATRKVVLLLETKIVHTISVKNRQILQTTTTSAINLIDDADALVSCAQQTTPLNTYEYINDDTIAITFVNKALIADRRSEMEGNTSPHPPSIIANKSAIESAVVPGMTASNNTLVSPQQSASTSNTTLPNVETKSTSSLDLSLDEHINQLESTLDVLRRTLSSGDCARELQSLVMLADAYLSYSKRLFSIMQCYEALKVVITPSMRRGHLALRTHIDDINKCTFSMKHNFQAHASLASFVALWSSHYRVCNPLITYNIADTKSYRNLVYSVTHFLKTHAELIRCNDTVTSMIEEMLVKMHETASTLSVSTMDRDESPVAVKSTPPVAEPSQSTIPHTEVSSVPNYASNIGVAASPTSHILTTANFEQRYKGTWTLVLDTEPFKPVLIPVVALRTGDNVHVRFPDSFKICLSTYTLLTRLRLIPDALFIKEMGPGADNNNIQIAHHGLLHDRRAQSTLSDGGWTWDDDRKRFTYCDVSGNSLSGQTHSISTTYGTYMQYFI